MDKMVIMPQVTVYRNVLSEDQIDLLLKEIYESQIDIQSIDNTDPAQSAYYDYHGPQPEDKKDGTLIYTWTPWYTFGMRSIWSDLKNPLTDKKEHVDGYKIIKDAIAKVHFDYLDDYKDSGRWTYNIDKWNILEEEDANADNMSLSTFEILQHRLNLDTNYTIGVHTDWHEHRVDEPGPKQILTYTMYLNDDYEGGEIDFVDEENKHVIVYKPKRGDITVFPSGRPYWHGARAVKSDPNKIFIRSFAVYRSPGTREWNLGLKMYGPTRWMEMQSKKIKDYIDEGNVGRQLVFEGNEPNTDTNLTPLYIKSETYIDGRTI